MNHKKYTIIIIIIIIIIIVIIPREAPSREVYNLVEHRKASVISSWLEIYRVRLVIQSSDVKVHYGFPGNWFPSTTKLWVLFMKTGFFICELKQCLWSANRHPISQANKREQQTQERSLPSYMILLHLSCHPLWAPPRASRGSAIHVF